MPRCAIALLGKQVLHSAVQLGQLPSSAQADLRICNWPMHGRRLRHCLHVSLRTAARMYHTLRLRRHTCTCAHMPVHISALLTAVSYFDSTAKSSNTYAHAYERCGIRELPCVQVNAYNNSSIKARGGWTQLSRCICMQLEAQPFLRVRTCQFLPA